MNEYKVTVFVEGEEAIESLEYWVKACSLEEAVKNIKYELDID